MGWAVRLMFTSGDSTEYADGVLEEVNDRASSGRSKPTPGNRRGSSSTRGAPSSSSSKREKGKGGASWP